MKPFLSRKVKECRTRIKSAIGTTVINVNEERSEIQEDMTMDE